ncbi:hypothetical protein ElyMa_005454700 [Elysia marginata]|uniref:Secreted protein n=1 Tax=Elysia marginata TaxID=1093978 RepID=A0AAV4ENY8_9GAST|nr:hypothetical protein ElyMa_005454700 [Elysia marginata]
MTVAWLAIMSDRLSTCYITRIHPSSTVVLFIRGHDPDSANSCEAMPDRVHTCRSSCPARPLSGNNSYRRMYIFAHSICKAGPAAFHTFPDC